MYSERWIPLVCLCAISLAPAHAEEFSEELASNAAPTLQARPATCVALHRGQRCYVRIRVSWTGLDDTAYCLHAESEEETMELACWRGMAQDHHYHAYATANSIRYVLVRQSDAAVVLDATVRTGWVYRTNRRSASGWRLF